MTETQVVHRPLLGITDESVVDFHAETLTTFTVAKLVQYLCGSP